MRYAGVQLHEQLVYAVAYTQIMYTVCVRMRVWLLPGMQLRCSVFAMMFMPQQSSLLHIAYLLAFVLFLECSMFHNQRHARPSVPSYLCVLLLACSCQQTRRWCPTVSTYSQVHP